MSDCKAKMHQIADKDGKESGGERRGGEGPPALPLHPSHYILDISLPTTTIHNLFKRSRLMKTR